MKSFSVTKLNRTTGEVPDAPTSVKSEIRTVLDDPTQNATQAFLKHIAHRYPVREALLFGSRASNTHTPESDADIAVVLKGPHGNRAAAHGEALNAVHRFRQLGDNTGEPVSNDDAQWSVARAAAFVSIILSKFIANGSRTPTRTNIPCRIERDASI